MATPPDPPSPAFAYPATAVPGGTAARFRELHGVAAVLVPAHGESLFVFSPRMAHPWVRHHDRSREAALRTLVRDLSDPLRRDLEHLLGSVAEAGPPGAELVPDHGADTADALRRLGGGSALVVRWHGDADPPAGIVVVRSPGRDPANAATWSAMEGAHRGLRLLGPGAPPTPAEVGLLGATLDGVGQALVAVDGSGRIQLWNRAAEHLLGWDRTDRLGTPLAALDVRTLGGDPMELTPPGPREAIRVRDCLIMGGDGAWIPVRVETRRLPGPADASPLLLTVAPFRREESDQLRSGTWDRPLEDLLLASPVPMVALDDEGRVRLWSAAAERVFGWPPGEVLGGRHPLDPPEGAGLLEEMDRALLRRPWGQIEADLIRKDGTLLRVVVSGSRIRDPGGGVAGTLLSLVDVTHTHRMEEQIRQAQRMQAVGELAGGVAHDFNNILTRVTGLTEVIRLQLDEGHPALAAVEEVERTAMEAAEVADNLMAFSRQRMIRFEPLDLAATLRDLEPALRQAVSAEVRLELSLPDEPAVVRGDRGQVQQAMLNLAANAAAAMPGGGRLDVEVEARVVEPEDVQDLPYPMDPGEYVALTVRDTGVGMSESTLARVFEPFFSARVTGDAFEAGRGLGLSATYGIIKQMGGYVWVESEEGVGTVFSLLFPREIAPPAPEDGAPEPAPDPRGSETVLLVEDDAQVLSLLERALQQRGYTVHSARGGPEALGVFRMAEERIDVLVTDVVMPRMRGTELARRLRRDRPGLPVIFITGYTDDPELRTGLLEPDQAILEKPFRPRDVSVAVRELLDRTRRASG